MSTIYYQRSFLKDLTSLKKPVETAGTVLLWNKPMLFWPCLNILFPSLVSADGPMSWLIKNNDVPDRVNKRPSTCPATCPSRTNASDTSTSNAAAAVSQDDSVVR